MKRVFLLVLILSIIGIPLLAQEKAVRSAEEEMILAEEYRDKWDHENAIIQYLKVLELDPANYEAAWKAGDEYTELADNLPEDQNQQKETYFNQAEKYCLRAIEIDPDGFEGHLRLSVVYGRLGLFRGGKEKVKLAKQVKAEAEKALELNPQSDIALHVLGRWEQNVANLSGVLKFFSKVFFGEELKGSNEQAAELFKKAIEIDPAHIEHYLELARTYEFMKEKEMMRDPLDALLKLPDIEEDDPDFKEEAREMLKKLK